MPTDSRGKRPCEKYRSQGKALGYHVEFLKNLSTFCYIT